MSLVPQTKKSGCREEKSLPESLRTSRPHADENTCACLVSKRVLGGAAAQAESLGLCSAHAEVSPRCLQNWPEKLGAGSLQLQAKQRTQLWVAARAASCAGWWVGTLWSQLQLLKGYQGFSGSSCNTCFVQWGKIPAVLFWDIGC